MEIETLVRDTTELPYALAETPGATALLVAFPKLRPGVVKPATGMRKYVEGLKAHTLYLGSDAYQFVGPNRQMHGAGVALELVRSVREEFGIAEDRVAFFGTSYGAALACILGLLHGGVVLGGAPPIAMGSGVSEWSEVERVGKKAGRASFIALGEGDGDLTPVEWLDTLISRLADVAERPVRMRFVTGLDDYGYASTLALVAQAKHLRNVDAKIVKVIEDVHADVARAFWPLFPKLLNEELGLR